MKDKYSNIDVEREEEVVTVKLDRPSVHNAFNDETLEECSDAFEKIDKDEQIRVVVLTGSGESFCSGADLNWMQSTVDYTYEENIEDANKISDCMYALYSLSQPTICWVNGAAIGGGVGFVATCDIVVADAGAVFSLSEVKAGLVPACISPYVIKRLGESASREYFLTGEKFDTETGNQIGLVNRVAEDARQEVDDLVSQLLSSGPEAISYCKELISEVPSMDFEEARKYTAEMIARIRVGDEGQEGIKAFLENRKPDWVKD